MLGDGKGGLVPTLGAGKGGGPPQGRMKGGKGSGPRRPPQAVPESFALSPDARLTGAVKVYRKFNGFGFVELAQKGVVPDDTVYVHWRDIQTQDRYPQLAEGMEVELSVHKVKDKRSNAWTLRGKDVTTPGGGPISVQDDLDAQQLTFVGAQNLRYTGRLQFFSPQRGFGWIAMDDGYALPEPVPKEIRVDVMEVNAGGKQPLSMRDIAVEFGIMKTKKGSFKGYNMTLPGGIPMTQEAVENRNALEGVGFTGIVELYNWRKGWGFIKAAPGTAFPPNVVDKIKQMQDDSTQRGKTITSPDLMLFFRRDDVAPGLQLEKGQQVTFSVYTDDKGAGAFDIK